MRTACFFESINGVYGVNIRSNTSGTPTDTFVPQANWNLDKVDGTGPSGKTVDFTKAQIYVIDYEWLGVGRVRFGIVTNGGITYVHQFTHFNVLTTVYMSLPNLPLQYEIINDGTGPASTLTGICSTVMSEGTGQDGSLKGLNGTTVSSLSAGTTYALIGLRLKSTHHSSGIEFVNASWVATDPSAQVFQTSLRLNPTVASEPNFTGIDDSPLERYLGTSTHTVTGGTILLGGVTSAQQAFQIARTEIIRFGSSINGTRDRLIVCATPINNNMTIAASISWKELN